METKSNMVSKSKLVVFPPPLIYIGYASPKFFNKENGTISPVNPTKSYKEITQLNPKNNLLFIKNI